MNNINYEHLPYATNYELWAERIDCGIFNKNWFDQVSVELKLRLVNETFKHEAVLKYANEIGFKL